MVGVGRKLSALTLCGTEKAVGELTLTTPQVHTEYLKHSLVARWERAGSLALKCKSYGVYGT